MAKNPSLNVSKKTEEETSAGSKAPSPAILDKAREVVNQYFSQCKDDLSENRRRKLLEIYEAYVSFTQKKESRWSSSFKVNKAFEIVEGIVPRLMARNPTLIVTGKYPEVEQEAVEMLQDFLKYLFDEYSLRDQFRLWAKSMCIGGKGYAKAIFKRERVGSMNGITGDYPTIRVISWSDIYYDPRYVSADDRPGVIEVASGIRLAEIMSNQDEYFNLQELKNITEVVHNGNDDQYKKQVLAIAGIANVDKVTIVDKNALSLRIYYGLFSESDDPKEEKLYQITMVNDLLVIGLKEIPCIPIEEIKCFEDPESGYATGYVEPIISLQDELNFKKNSASEYINRSLVRQVIMSGASGIDPRTINDPVIWTVTDGQTALNNFVELPHRQIPSEYFGEQNDLERQIQGITHTVDTASPRSENALTNTATGIRVKFYESNSVIEDVRKRFERGIERIAYKLLQLVFEKNTDEIIVFKKQGTDEYWKIHKSVIEDAVRKYTIRAEAGSSSFDSIETKREDAIAKWNLSSAAARQGVPVDLTKVYKKVMTTFEGTDPEEFLLIPQINQALDFGAFGATPIPNEGAPNDKAAEITQKVAQGNLTPTR